MLATRAFQDDKETLINTGTDIKRNTIQHKKTECTHTVSILWTQRADHGDHHKRRRCKSSLGGNPSWEYKAEENMKRLTCVHSSMNCLLAVPVSYHSYNYVRHYDAFFMGKQTFHKALSLLTTLPSSIMLTKWSTAFCIYFYTLAVVLCFNWKAP